MVVVIDGEHGAWCFMCLPRTSVGDKVRHMRQECINEQAHIPGAATHIHTCPRGGTYTLHRCLRCLTLFRVV